MTPEEFLIANIGKPWVSGDAGPDSFDCWGLVRYFYSEVEKVELPVVDLDALQPLAVRREFASDANRFGWVEIEKPLDGAAVLLSKNTRPAHIGISVSGGILHCVKGAGVIYQQPTQLKIGGWNVLGFYRRVK